MRPLLVTEDLIKLFFLQLQEIALGFSLLLKSRVNDRPASTLVWCLCDVFKGQYIKRKIKREKKKTQQAGTTYKAKQKQYQKIGGPS